MNLLNNISIRMKILLMLSLPLMGLIYFSMISVLEKSDVVAEMDAVQPLAELAVKASSLVHETQKERGATAGFIGSKGQKFASELPAQRTNTDAKLAELRAFLGSFDSSAYGSGFESDLKSVMAKIDRLSSIRNQVSSLAISGKEAIGYYTGINGAFLGLVGTMTELTSNGDILRNIAAYVNFLQGKERAGVERAVMANTFAKDSFGPGMFNKFSALVTEQDTYVRVFASLASADARQFYEQTMNAPEVETAAQMRAVAFEKSFEGGFNIEPVVWFKTQTAKINLLKKVEDNLSAALIAQVEGLHGSAEAAEFAYILMSLLGIAVAVIVGLFVARNITGALNQALVALEDIAEGEGDLTRRLDSSGRDEIAKLTGAFNKFVGKIEDMVVQIKETAGAMDSSTKEISAGNMNLSQRTEEQASSLEETASSMEEMTSTVKTTADNARQANQLAVSARDEAEKGGQVVSDAVAAMSEISGSSKKIADIIGVIDEIAFQTNLLALNAAVEAARAGEQGRGFAVVAGEVRTLAGRSADAAKEIKGLIQDSVAKVQQGTELVDASGKTLEDIVAGVKKVTDIVSEMAAASQEQATGIEQVNKAVMQMDEMTQQNAALVEEAASNSEELSEQGHALNELVSQFKVSSGTGAAVVNPVSERRASSRPFSGNSQQSQSVQHETPRQESVTPMKKTGTDDEWSEF
jgi:methyl-accepting chemotaxis protein